MSAIDQNLYSRQIYVMGMDAMKKMSASSVLISGIGGLGVEIAKNIILAGVKQVTIQDTKSVTLEDLAGNFYVTEESIGMNRAKASLSSLTNLNRYVTVNATSEPLDEGLIKGHNCFVLTDWQKEEDIKKWSTFCHENKIKFIFSDVRGLFGILFTDFGEDFLIKDATGEEPVRFNVSNITNAKRGVVSSPKGKGHGFQQGDNVKFEGVEGMTEVNGKIFKAKVHDDRHLIIADTTKYGKFENTRNTAVAIQVKPTKKVSYLPYVEAIKSPKFEISEFSDPEIHAQTILLFLGYQRCVTDSNKVTAEQLMEKCAEINAEIKIVDTISEFLVGKFSETCESVISPMAGIFGGFAGQEVLKAITGKFTPLNQFFALGYMNSAPENVVFEPKGDRYDAYRRIFGNEQQETIENLRYFMIGAGALGCELLKNWALMGLSTGEKGRIIVTDMDKIEISNLSRQFLFHDKDVGKMKSNAAAESVLLMNPKVKITPQTFRLAEDTTKDIYNDDFYDGIDGVCNALDNLQARLFSDKLCVQHDKPMLESGTLGTKAHFQVVIPKITESYSSQKDSDSGGVAFCTVHYYPRDINHTTLWALDFFAKTFEEKPQMVNKYLDDADFIEKTKADDPGAVFNTVDAVKDLLIENHPTTFIECARLARHMYQTCFVDQIKEVLHNNPPDSLDEKGKPFWFGEERKMPNPLPFNPEDDLHKEFIRAAARLIADEYGIKVEGDATTLIGDVVPVEWVHKEAPARDLENVKEEDYAPARKCAHLLVNSFEKDDDNNGHIDFISAASNLRARCYGIVNVNKLEIKRLAGKITPAIATTTAMICGFVSLELYKVHCVQKKKLEDYRLGFFNLADDMAIFTVPNPPPKMTVTSSNETFDLWDKWVFKASTLRQFISDVEAKAKASITTIGFNDKIIVTEFNKSGDNPDLDKTLKEILEVTGFEFVPGNHLIRITVLFIDQNGDVIPTPTIFADFN
jgi:ubiquitin-activating enzyme E1